MSTVHATCRVQILYLVRVYHINSKPMSNQCLESGTDGLRDAFQSVVLAEQSWHDAIHTCRRLLTAVSITDATTWQRCTSIQIRQVGLAFHHVLASQTVNSLVEAVRVVRTESVTQYTITHYSRKVNVFHTLDRSVVAGLPSCSRSQGSRSSFNFRTTTTFNFCLSDYLSGVFLQCSDTVGWATGRTSGL